MAGVQKGILYKPQENSKGKLRLLLYKKSAMSGAKRPLEIVPLLAEPDELKNDKDWRDRLEFRPSEFKKRARYAILLDSAWQDVVKDIYISDVVRFSSVGDKGNDDHPLSWLAGVQSFTLQKKMLTQKLGATKEVKFRFIPENRTNEAPIFVKTDVEHRTNEHIIPLYGSIDSLEDGRDAPDLIRQHLEHNVEFRPSEYHKNRYFAVVLDSPWKDVDGPFDGWGV